VTGCGPSGSATIVIIRLCDCEMGRVTITQLVSSLLVFLSVVVLQ
jgi:hypothetical protein